jgi:hypothetical protein
MASYKERRLMEFWTDVCDGSNIGKIKITTALLIPHGGGNTLSVMSFISMIFSVLVRHDVGISRSGAFANGQQRNQGQVDSFVCIEKLVKEDIK